MRQIFIRLCFLIFIHFDPRTRYGRPVHICKEWFIYRAVICIDLLSSAPCKSIQLCSIISFKVVKLSLGLGLQLSFFSILSNEAKWDVVKASFL